MAKAGGLTPKSLLVLRFIERYIDQHGLSPRYTEIAEGCGLHTISYVSFHLDKLQREGYISRQFNRARSIILLRRSSTPTAVSPSTIEDCVMLITDALASSVLFPRNVSIVPDVDGHIFMQWPNNGPSYILHVSLDDTYSRQESVARIPSVV